MGVTFETCVDCNQQCDNDYGNYCSYYGTFYCRNCEHIIKLEDAEICKDCDKLCYMCGNPHKKSVNEEAFDIEDPESYKHIFKKCSKCDYKYGSELPENLHPSCTTGVKCHSCKNEIDFFKIDECECGNTYCEDCKCEYCDPETIINFLKKHAPNVLDDVKIWMKEEKERK